MSCNLTREEVARVVLEVIRGVEQMPGIDESTRFEEDIRVDSIARRAYFIPVKESLADSGCALEKVTPGDFGKAKNVKKIIDTIWNAVKPEERK